MASRITDAADRILQEIQSSSSGLTQLQLSSLVGRSKAQVCKHCNDLISKGLIKKTQLVSDSTRRASILYMPATNNDTTAVAATQSAQSSTPLVGRCCRCFQAARLAVFSPKAYCRPCAIRLKLITK